MNDWVKIWEYVDSIKEQRQELYEALAGLMPEGWDTGIMDHMPGIKSAREALAKYAVYYPEQPTRDRE